MASYFRRKIAQKILLDLRKQSCDVSLSEDNLMSLVSLLKVNKKISKSPEFILPLTSKLQGKIMKDIQQNSTHFESIKTEEICSVKSVNEEIPYLLFAIDPSIFKKEVLGNVTIRPEDFWKSSSLINNMKSENIIVEFSSPNIAKPIHAGHLRSTIIGNFIANISESLGHRVQKLNFLGDWGTQFGILSVGFSKFGSKEELARDPIKHLFNVYVKANAELQKDETFLDLAKQHFKKLEEGDKEALEEWEYFRKLSIEDLQKTYARLGVTFNEYHGESMYRRQTLSFLDSLKDNKILETASDGSFSVELGPDRKIILAKNDGSTLYISRDIEAALDRRKKYKFDKMYYVVENGQSDHFNALFNILALMELDWHKDLHHIKFGRIHNLSTRQGNVVFLQDILDEAKLRMLETMKESSTTKVQSNDEAIADILGVSAVIINDLKSRRQKDYKFSWEKILQLRGDTGPYLQYTYARLCSLEEQCGIKLDLNADVSYLSEPQVVVLICWIARFDEILMNAYNELEPCILVQYLFQLSRHINAAFQKLNVKNQPEPVAKGRLLLFHSSKLVLKAGLKILGLKTLDKI